MDRILIIDTTHPVNTRTSRFKNTFSKFLTVTVCSWSRRTGPLKTIPGEYIYETNIGYGGKIKKLLHLPFFVLFCIKVFKKTRSEIIFASHWDSLICAVAIKFCCDRDVKILYDCLDIPTASSNHVLAAIRWIEKVNLKFVDLTIFASRYFKELYPPELKSFVFENHYSLNYLDEGKPPPAWLKNFDVTDLKSKKSVAWIGVVRYFDIIKNILLSIKGESIYLYIFGDGPDLHRLVMAVEDLGLSEQVIFFGRYQPEDLPIIYTLTDLVWAAYPTNDFNAVYAISNKFFECSYFCKTPIFSKKTRMADDLMHNPNVILVDEYSIADIRSKLTKFSPTTDGKFVKYTPDTSWEKKETQFIEQLRTVL